MTTAIPTNKEKEAVWNAYRERHPTRVPLRWSVNCRIVVLDPALNPENYQFEQVFNDPHVALTVQSRFQEYVHSTLATTCDTTTEQPEAWNGYVDGQNTTSAYFGAAVEFRDGEVPCNEPCHSLDTVDEFLEQDFSEPLKNPWIQDRLAFHAALVREAETFEYKGKKCNINPFSPGAEGVLTTATCIFGEDIYLLMAMDPEKATRVLEHILRSAMLRNQAVAEYNGGWERPKHGWYADDSIQLISTDMYRDIILPLHRAWYDEMSTSKAEDRTRFIHLCGDATRHFKTIRDELGVTSFDTGFPVDHGALRRELGPAVEISGGPHVSLLQTGTANECFEDTRRILQSGIMEGGRFILQEGNNLPPGCPMENLAAVYEACREFGVYSAPS